ncbi:peptidase of plants and bacteria domain-containing protein [Hirsutella rhossiliensis]|uniref:Peptidase of plants and bacteria domain-containing protein n=1 Tax=Hirsutella rhossiliensis TaxID=111463 RepID=A0A9P8N2T0_9HYPO|nr:peptidase of plants and bacteria domain-containing protein [Hirsutella rhossiliensis]KAH0966613.1 peptidase of plants and bacteria domain-containing protein [Hirsutella rhossiliensis]
MSTAVLGPAADRPEIDGPCSGAAEDRRPTEGHGQRRRRLLRRPKLRLEIRDLAHPGTSVFLAAVDPIACVTDAIANVARLLYHATVVDSDAAAADDDDDVTPFHPPPTRSVTLVLREMPGIAYTASSDLDADHKEVHLSLAYLARLPSSRAAAEVAGVVTHELVHCFQHNGLGTCPGGLVEGVADWVRLRCGLAPPHWARDHDGGGGWDAGYQTTAYFLDHLDTNLGGDFVPRLNEKLRVCRYDEAAFWYHLSKMSVQQRWTEYGLGLKAQDHLPDT